MINSTALAPWVSAGLSIEANLDDESGIIFQLGWRMKEFNAFLQNSFPTLFQYLGAMDPKVLTIRNEPDNTGLKSFHYSWPYVLLKKDRLKYKAVDCTHPTALIY